MVKQQITNNEEFQSLFIQEVHRFTDLLCAMPVNPSDQSRMMSGALQFRYFVEKIVNQIVLEHPEELKERLSLIDKSLKELSSKIDQLEMQYVAYQSGKLRVDYIANYETLLTPSKEVLDTMFGQNNTLVLQNSGLKMLQPISSIGLSGIMGAGTLVPTFKEAKNWIAVVIGLFGPVLEDWEDISAIVAAGLEFFDDLQEYDPKKPKEYCYVNVFLVSLRLDELHESTNAIPENWKLKFTVNKRQGREFSFSVKEAGKISLIPLKGYHVIDRFRDQKCGDEVSVKVKVEAQELDRLPQKDDVGSEEVELKKTCPNFHYEDIKVKVKVDEKSNETVEMTAGIVVIWECGNANTLIGKLLAGKTKKDR